MRKGILYLIPTTLGETGPEKVLPEYTLSVIRKLTCFIVEEIRTARRFLKRADYPFEYDKTQFLIFNEHTRRSDLSCFLQPMIEGIDCGLLSEAGTPCIADPGSEIVELAHGSGIRVIPLTGPSSLLLALMASGFNGQNFAFHGYLPVDKQQRKQKIAEMEKSALGKGQTQLFIETPYRNQALFEALIQLCHPATRICIAINLTSDNEQVLVNSVAEWRKKPFSLPKEPATFLIYR
ncbi:MAG: SAM-dependent methyltransferase [bacterium]